MTNNMPDTGGAASVTQKALRVLLCVAALVLLFSLYTWGVSQNPPGFYLDESATALQRLSRLPNWGWRIRTAVSRALPQFAVSNPTYMNPSRSI